MNEEYILMSKEAWEDLEPLLGFNMDSLWCDGYYVSFKTPVFELGEDNEWIRHIIYEIKNPFETEEFVVARQEELQEILFDYYGCHVNHYLINIGQVLARFNSFHESLWEKKIPKYPWDQYKSIAELWLGCVMETCFSKFWNCETKTWEEINEGRIE